MLPSYVEEVILIYFYLFINISLKTLAIYTDFDASVEELLKRNCLISKTVTLGFLYFALLYI